MYAPLRRLIALLLLPLLPLEALGNAAFAQGAPGPAALPGDPPARVGRLSHIDGQVSARPPEQADWSAAPLNYPVSTGLSLWTEPGARAEVTYGDGAFRLDSETAIGVTRLDDAAVDLRLEQGSVQVSVRQLGPAGRVAVETPGGRMEALAPGTYRIDSGTGDQPAGVSVIDGKARFGNNGRSMEAIGGEAAFALADGTLAKGAAHRDAFDDWAMAREEQDRAAAASVAKYVPPQMTGYEDLNRHGTWQQTPDYGAIWYPTSVPVEWAPYRYGHWAWVAPWGWTWIDDAPWGFAPFHYGRWVQHRGRWCWAPGYHHARPIYSPALVAFVGGSGFSIAVSIGRAPAIGWVPLGPREVYRPPYRSSVTYVRNINITHVDRVVINNINTATIRKGPPERDIERFTNRRAATVVPVDAMRRAEPVARAAPRRQFDADDLRGARPTTDLASVTPTRAARAGFETEYGARPRGGDDRPAARQLAPGRPITADPERLPAAPTPRREARTAPERAGPDRGGADRGSTIAPSAAPSAPQRIEARPEARPDARPEPRQSAPADRGDRIPAARGAPTQPTMPGAPESPRRPEEQRRPMAVPEVRVQPSAGGDRRPAVPAMQQPQRVETPRAARIEPPRTEQTRPEQPRTEQPRTEQPRTEQPRTEQARPERQQAEQPRIERRRIEQPQPDARPDSRFASRPEQRRPEQPRVEQPRLEQPQRRAEQPRMEQPRADQLRPERRTEPQRAETPSAVPPQRQEAPRPAPPQKRDDNDRKGNNR